MCPDSSKYVQTVQNMVGRERWLRTFLVCRERDLRVFCPENIWVPPRRYKVLGLCMFANIKWKWWQHNEITLIRICPLDKLLFYLHFALETQCYSGVALLHCDYAAGKRLLPKVHNQEKGPCYNALAVHMSQTRDKEKYLSSSMWITCTLSKLLHVFYSF